MGVHPEHRRYLPPKKQHLLGTEDIPDEFDPRQKWPNCPSISEIRDQVRLGHCLSHRLLFSVVFFNKPRSD
jgi:cathepsin B